ncbi:PREDICTED: endogenous retrovirus group K member 8 Pol protein-like [Pseudopodoces humilis]|uniref:endogenous retrovirus group K member 8 Pol protein-like n=1 Tax=Pseudopodoces humilis TaxID=181119 RepID=UPI0006B7414B|nr:PREDICTED: endogenous retrovirus group K member 8 Pol protein-like [Pseudopodoces humilis]
MAQLSPLFGLLKGDSDLKSPRTLTPEAQQVLEEVQRAVSARQVHRIDPSIDVAVFIVTPDLHPAGIIGQWNDEWSDPLHVLEWIFLPHQPQKAATAMFELIARLIIKCRQRCLQLMGADPAKIVLPVPPEDFDWSFANSISMQSVLENFSGQIAYHLPSHKLLQVANFTKLSLRPRYSQEPVQGPPVFTDGSGRTGKAIATWKEGSGWQVLESHETGSAQLVELRAAIMAFQKFSQEPFNLVTDSAYVAGIAQWLGHSVLKEVSNPALFHLLKALWSAIQARVHPYYVLHVRSHTSLPGFIAEGNARADKLANPAWVAPQPDTLSQAKASHGFFHQNAHTLQKQLQLMSAEAHDIVESCDDCHALAAPLPAGVNPRGLQALELWQTDVTQVAVFGRLRYVHVSVDTFSSAMWASAHAGEKACDVIAHWKQAFAVLGVPSAVKTDNGPAYASQKVRQFLQLWGVSHKFGIPHSPTGQAIVERAHGTLKRVLQKQKRGMQGETPHSWLGKALYTLNHLTVPQNSSNPVMLNHHLSLRASDETPQPRAKVRVRNLVTKQWEGPYDLIASGRGYACVSTDTGVCWVPAKCVRPDLQPQRQHLTGERAGGRDQIGSDGMGGPTDEDSDVDDVRAHPDGPSTSRC